MSKKAKVEAALAAKQRVEQGLEALRSGLGPYVAKHMQDRYGPSWRHYASRARGVDAKSPELHFPRDGRA